MKWRRFLGAFLLLITLLLAILLTVKIPFTKTNKIYDDKQITVSSNGEPYSLNITVDSSNKTDYHVEVTLSPYYKMDFWAVNASGLGILTGFISTGETFRSEYPGQYPYTTIKTYAKAINVTQTTSFELKNLTYNGTYCLAFLNFYADSQNVSVTVEERYLESVHTVLEPNLFNIVTTVLVLIAGIYFVVPKRRKPHRRANRLRNIQSFAAKKFSNPCNRNVKSCA